jgi:hypothetical protein
MFSTEDSIAMKVQAILGRGKKKDFWDIAELLKHFTVSDFIQFHMEKYSSQNLLITVPQAMTYFADAEDYIGLRVGAGSSPDERRLLLFSGSQSAHLKSLSARADYNHIFNNRWIFSTSVGFANEEFDEYITPTLSSIDQQTVQMGRRAFKMLLGLIEDGTTKTDLASKIILEPIPFYRESSLKRSLAEADSLVTKKLYQ